MRAIHNSFCLMRDSADSFRRITWPTALGFLGLVAAEVLQVPIGSCGWRLWVVSAAVVLVARLTRCATRRLGG